MEELNLIELLRYYLKRLPIILAVLLLATLTTFVYVKNFKVPLYHGTTTIILVQKQSDEMISNTKQSELTINEKLVSTYTQIIKSRRVLEQVINNLNLDTPVDILRNRISVTTESNFLSQPVKI